jgi:hypothetical protein
VRLSLVTFLCGLGLALSGCGGGGSAVPAQPHLGVAAPNFPAAAAQPSYASAVLADSPISYYRLNDIGTTMADSGPKNIAGVFGTNVKHGGTALTSPSGSQSSIFPGAAAGADIPSNTGTVTANALFATAAQSFTVEAWVRPTVANTTGKYVPLVSYGREIVGNAWVLQLSPQSTVVFYMKAKGGAASSYLLNTNVALTPGQVYAIAATYNGATVSVYVNGKLATTSAATGSIDYSGLAPQWGLAIGGASGSTEPVFNGAISDVSIYPSALPAGEITNHYVAGTISAPATPAPTAAPGPTSAYGKLIASSGPLAYYKLGDTGMTLSDSGPNALNGTYGAHVTHGAAPMTSSKDASSVFPGGSAGEDIPSNTAAVPANATLAIPSTSVSIETWIKLADYNRTNNFVPVVAYGRGAIGNVWALQITPQTTLAFYVKVNGAAGSYLLKSIALLPQQIYHIIATYDGSKANVYVNGSLAGTMPATGTLNYSGLSAPYGLTIGGSAGSSTPVFNGAINDVSVYPSALSAAAVASHYLTGQLIVPTVETPAASDGFVDSIGVVTHLRATGPYTSNFPAFKALLQSSGIRHIGDAFTTTPAWYPQEIRTLAAAGIHASLITDPTQTAQAITATLPAFAGSIEAIEGLNEPDINGGANWVADTRTFQQMLYATVKGNPATANLPVVGPSITSQANASALGDLSAYMDLGSMHDYFNGYNPGNPGWGSLSKYGTYGSLSYNKNITASVSGSKPIFATETGYGDSPGDTGGVGNQTLARYIPRVYLEHFMSGIKRTTMYEFYDEPGNGNFDDYGLVGLGNTPKPSYYAIKSLIAALADPGTSFSPAPLSYVLSGSLNNVQHLLLQKRDGTYELVVWLETPSYNPSTKTDVSVPAQTLSLLPVKLPANATISTIGDSGILTTAALAFPNGTATFAIDDHVSIVSFK